MIDRFGNTVVTLTDAALLDGPRDLTVHDEEDRAEVFVSNVLSGTITRIDFQIPGGGNPVVVSETQIASGYLHRTDPAAFVVGPKVCGDALGRDVDQTVKRFLSF